MTKRSPTILDVADAAGVSIATVSRALNGGTISAVAQGRVEQAVARLGYRRNTLARSLVTGRTGVVGVLIPDVVGPLYAQMARGVEDVLTPLGMHFMMVTDNRDLEQERTALELLLERRVDALVVIGSGLAQDVLKELAGSVPVVLVQRETADDAVGYGVIEFDNHGGTVAALEHLFDKGHRRIAHLSGLRRDGAARLASYRAFMAERGLIPLVLPGESSEEGGYRAGLKLAEMPVGAVYCSNDRVAVGLYHALKTSGKRVPDDVSVVGFDDLPWTAYLDPPLTTVRQPGREMGRAAAEQALAALRGTALEEPVRILPELVLRASVAGQERG